MKTFKNSASDEVFSFLEDFILEADKRLGSQSYMLKQLGGAGTRRSLPHR